jgi:hypothetical protein
MPPSRKPRADNGLATGDIAVDRHAATPLWLQLRLLIKRQIQDGSPGRKLERMEAS